MDNQSLDPLVRAAIELSLSEAEVEAISQRVAGYLNRQARQGKPLLDSATSRPRRKRGG